MGSGPLAAGGPAKISAINHGHTRLRAYVQESGHCDTPTFKAFGTRKTTARLSSFWQRLDETVFITPIAVHTAAIVAFFVGVEEVIPAFKPAASIASVAVHLSAIVAVFSALHLPISTLKSTAGVAAIARIQRPIITGLIAIDLPIATLDAAEGIAAIVTDSIAIVALFPAIESAITAL